MSLRCFRPCRFPSRCRGHWWERGFFSDGHTLLIGRLAIGTTLKAGLWTRPALLLLGAIATADVFWMIAFAGVHLSTVLLAAPPLCLFLAWRMLDPRTVGAPAA